MKFKALLAAFTVLAITAGVSAQSPAPTPDFSPNAFRAHVAYLADDRLEGRAAGSRGYELAAQYVAAQYESLGLQPGAAGNWFQPVRLVRYEIQGTPRLILGGRTFSHGRDFILRASPDERPLSLDAPLIFAGYGLDLPARGFDDYAGLDASGRIVVVLDGHPDGMPSDVGAHLDSEKAHMAAARGAVGMLVLRSQSDNEQLSWTRFARFPNRPRTTWIDREGRPFDSGGLRFNATVDPELAALLFAGAPSSLDEVQREAARLGARPGGFSLAGSAHFEREGGRLTRFASPNVIGVLPGTDPSVAGEYVLLMAHLDGLGVSTPAADARPGEDRIRNGAMDNASGVATLIEVAQAMSRPGHRPRRPMLFAAVTAEEVGLLGAAFLADNPVGAGRIVSVVNLDMPVLTYDFRDVTAFGAEHSTLGPIVARAAARMGVRLSPDPLPEEGLFTRSDHYPFVRHGVPSVFLMTGFEGEGRQRFTTFLEEYYHSPRDDMALPFDWNAGARFARLNYLIAREIADEAEAPRWYADSFFAAAVGQGQRLAARPASGGADASKGHAAPR
jgi:hypothetical protein